MVNFMATNRQTDPYGVGMDYLSRIMRASSKAGLHCHGEASMGNSLPEVAKYFTLTCSDGRKRTADAVPLDDVLAFGEKCKIFVNHVLMQSSKEDIGIETLHVDATMKIDGKEGLVSTIRVTREPKQYEHQEEMKE